jgi:hypothetical protein
MDFGERSRIPTILINFAKAVVGFVARRRRPDPGAARMDADQANLSVAGAVQPRARHCFNGRRSRTDRARNPTVS